MKTFETEKERLDFIANFHRLLDEAHQKLGDGADFEKYREQLTMEFNSIGLNDELEKRNKENE